MRIVKNLTAVAVALALVGSLAGCQFAARTAHEIVGQNQQTEQPITPGPSGAAGSVAQANGHGWTAAGLDKSGFGRRGSALDR